MGRKPFQQVNNEINRLRRVLEDPNNNDKLDSDIMQELQIKQTTYYRYKEKIREQDKEAWREMAKESLEERSKKIMNAINFALKINKEVAETSQDARAKIEASKKVVECQVLAYRLLEKGPKIMPKLEEKMIVESETESMGSIRTATV